MVCVCDEREILDQGMIIFQWRILRCCWGKTWFWIWFSAAAAPRRAFAQAQAEAEAELGRQCPVFSKLLDACAESTLGLPSYLWERLHGFVTCARLSRRLLSSHSLISNPM